MDLTPMIEAQQPAELRQQTVARFHDRAARARVRRGLERHDSRLDGYIILGGDGNSRGERALESTRGCQNDELDIRRSEPRAPCQALLPIVSLLPLPLPLTRTHAPIASLSGLGVN